MTTYLHNSAVHCNKNLNGSLIITIRWARYVHVCHRT